MRYLSAEKLEKDDFGIPFTMKEGEYVYDGRLAMSRQWATMSEKSWNARGCGVLGTGCAQKYQRNAEGHLIKVGG